MVRVLVEQWSHKHPDSLSRELPTDFFRTDYRFSFIQASASGKSFHETSRPAFRTIVTH